MLGKMKGLLFENDGTQPKHVKAPIKAVATSGPGVQPVATASVVVAIGVNNEMVDAIRKSTLSKKTAYTALIEATDKLVAVIPDLNTRLKAAYAMIGDSRSVQAIDQAIGIHLQDIESEKLRFSQGLANKRRGEIDVLKLQATQMQTSNQQIEQQIATLEQQVANLRQQSATNMSKFAEITGTVQFKEDELSRIASDFDTAAQTVRNDLETQRHIVLSTLAS